jgi:hypothetical protein
MPGADDDPHGLWLALGDRVQAVKAGDRGIPTLTSKSETLGWDIQCNNELD